ncbi:MAG: DNA methylase, partial [Floccifex sp.]
CNNVKQMKDTFEQLSLFENVEENIDQEKLNHTILEIQKKYGKNAIIKGTNLEQGATTLERNKQIGGHKA